MSNTDSPTRSADETSEDVVCDGYTMESVPPSSERKHLIQVDSINTSIPTDIRTRPTTDLRVRPTDVRTRPTDDIKARCITTDDDPIMPSNEQVATTPTQSHQTSDDDSNSSVHLNRSTVKHKSNNKDPTPPPPSGNNFFMAQNKPPAHTIPLAHPSSQNIDLTTSNFHSLQMHTTAHEQPPQMNSVVDSNNFFHQSTSSNINQLPMDTSNNFFAQHQHTLAQHNAPSNQRIGLSSTITPPQIPLPSHSPHSISPRSVSPKHNSPSSSPKHHTSRSRIIQTEDNNIAIPVVTSRIQTDSNKTVPDQPGPSLEEDTPVVPSSSGMGDIHSNGDSHSQNNFFLTTHQNRRVLANCYYDPSYDTPRESQTDYYPHSLPSRLNEEQQSSSTPPPPPHLSSLDLHTSPSLTRKLYTPATNVLASPNVPYDIQPPHGHDQSIKSNSTGSFTSSQSGNFYSSLPVAASIPLTGRGGGNSDSFGQPHMLTTPYSTLLQQGTSNIMQGGLQGLQGTQGFQGTQGLQGTQGFQGTQGVQGTQGFQGTQGLQGLQGTQGFYGTPQILQGTPQFRPPLSHVMHPSSYPHLKETLPQHTIPDPYYQLNQSYSPIINPPTLLQQPPIPQLLHNQSGYPTGGYSQIPDDPYSLLPSDNTSSNITSHPNIPNISGPSIPNITGPPNIPNIVNPVITAPNIADTIPPPYYNTTTIHYSTPTYSTTTTTGPLVTSSIPPLLTGYTTVTAPVSAATTPNSSQMITLSSPQPATTSNEPFNEDKSSSTFYSATEAEDSITTSEVVTISPKNPWLKLVQKYMNNLDQDKSPALSPPAAARRPHSPQRRTKNRKDDTSLLQKELEKSYERISSLEVRVQDLTSQVSSDIPEDKDLSLLSKEKLEQEFKKMRELKKKAEQQNVESRQTAQRLITENCRLKEELSQSKNECDMLVGELKSLKRKLVASEKIKEVKSEAIKKSLKESIEINLKDLDLTPIANPLTSEVSDYPSEEFTPQMLLDAINASEDKSVLTVGQVGVVGLPSSGKSSLLKGLLKHEIGKLTKPKGQDTCVEFYEVMSAKNPLTGDSQWKMSSGIDTAVQYLASVTAQYYYRRKRTPSFNNNTQSQSLARLFPDLTDSQMKATLNEIYKRVQTLLEDEKKRNSMTQLALFESVFMNIWDVGVNACLYQFLPMVAGQCEHLVLLNVLNLERDVPNFDEPPIMSQKESYRNRGDDESVMHVYGRQVYFMLMSGLKRWFNKNPPNLVAPEVLIVGTYTKELKPDAIQNLVRNLKVHLTALSIEFEIEGTIDMSILTYCIDGDKKLQDKDLSLIKGTLERVMAAQPNFMRPFDPKWMLFRSLYYDPSSLAVSLEELKRVGRSCGIVSHDRLNECLLTFKNVGSLLYGPDVKTAVTQSHVIIDIPRVFELLDRLFYFNYYQSFASTSSLSTDTTKEYARGLISMTLAEKVFTRQEAPLCLEYLVSCKVCVEITSIDRLTTMYFLPSLRKAKRSLTNYNKDSLYIQYHCHYSQCDQLVLFHKFSNNIFKEENRDLIEFVPYLEYNVTGIKYTNKQEGVERLIEVIYYPKIIEVRVIHPPPPSTPQDNLERGGEEIESTTSLSLCTKILKLCELVYSEVCKDIQNLKYEFTLLCPNCCHGDDDVDNADDAHFVNFYTNYKSVSLPCHKCETDVKFTDNRANWLASHRNT